MFPLLQCTYQCIRSSQDNTDTSCLQELLPEGLSEQIIYASIALFCYCSAQILCTFKNRKEIIFAVWTVKWTGNDWVHRAAHISQSNALCSLQKQSSLLFIPTKWVQAPSLKDEQLWLLCALQANIRSKWHVLSYFPLSSNVKNEVGHGCPGIIYTHLRYSGLLLNWNSTLFKNYLVLLLKTKNPTLMISRYQTMVRNLIILTLKREESRAMDADFQNGLI